MAHKCPGCGMECYCHGDIDDCVVSLPPANCACDCELDDSDSDEWPDDFEHEVFDEPEDTDE